MEPLSGRPATGHRRHRRSAARRRAQTALLALTLLGSATAATVGASPTPAVGAPAPAAAAAATEDDLAVITLGDGETPLPASNATNLPVSVRRYSGDGTANGDPWVLPSVADGANQPLTLPRAGRPGLFLSDDGRYLTLGGFGGVPVGSAYDGGGNHQLKTLALLGADGSVDTTTTSPSVLTSSGGILTDVLTTDGSRFWAIGSGATLTTVDHGTGATNVIFGSDGPASIRIFDGQLYSSHTSSIYPLGSGVPDALAEAVPGPAFISTANSGGGTGTFEMLDRDPAIPGLDTFYGVMGANIRKFGKNAEGVWTRLGQISFSRPDSLTSPSHMTAVAGDGEARIYVTDPDRNKIIRVTDVAGANETLDTPDGKVTIAEAPANTSFAGISVAPEGEDPEPEPALIEDLAVVQTPAPTPPAVNAEVLPVSLTRIDSETGEAIDGLDVPSEDGPNGRNALTLSSLPQEGGLSRSADGRYLVFAGHAGEGSLGTFSETTNGTAIARVDAEGSIDTTTRIPDVFLKGRPYGAVTDDGSRYWLYGYSSPPQDPFENASIRLAPHGGSTSTVIENFASRPNVTWAGIVQGDLWASLSSNFRVVQLGEGLPTTPQTTFTEPISNPEGVQLSSVSLVDLDPAIPGDDTLYALSVIGGSGIAKYSLVDGTWVRRGMLGGNFQHVRARVADDGRVDIFAIPTGLGSIVHTSDASGAAAAIAAEAPTAFSTAPAGQLYRGLEFAPEGEWAEQEPEPDPQGWLRVTSEGANGMISVDGVDRDIAALHAMPIEPGDHEVCAGPVVGFAAPACETVEVVDGGTTEHVVRYTRAARLRIRSEPVVASTITVDGVAVNEGTAELWVAPGSRQVCFGAVADHLPPACQTVAVAGGDDAEVVGTFTASAGAPGVTDAHGFLRVITDPAVGAPIVVDGVARATWGLNWLKVGPGSHEVCFGELPGTTAPACRTVTVTAGVTSEVAGTYQRQGELRVTTEPALHTGISIDGVVANAYGVWRTIAPGPHEVCFAAVEGYTSPVCQDVEVVAGATATVAGVFSPTA